MYLDFSKIKLDADGTPIKPTLRLQTFDGKTIGLLNGVSDLSMKIGWAELSEISFTVPYVTDGIVNPLYSQITGYKLIRTENYGVYVITSPETSGDGLQETKTVKGYSLEKRLERRNLFLSEGAYKLYDSDPDNPYAINNILKEIDPKWDVVCESDTLSTRYAWFDQYKNNVLTFFYNEILDKYRALAVFDTYEKKIHLYDADADVDSLPIYLSYKNLLEETSVQEITDELVTKLGVYGADDLSIRDVNPTGQDYLVELGYFIENGDISDELASKIKKWQEDIEAARTGYVSLANIKAMNSTKQLALRAKVVDLRGRMDAKTEEQNAIIKALSMLDKDKKYDDITEEEWNKKLEEVNGELRELHDEILSIEGGIDINEAGTETEVVGEIQNLQTVIDGITESMKASIAKFSLTKPTEYFDENDLAVISEYLIEDEVLEETFVATSVSDTGAGSYFRVYQPFTINETAGGYADISDLRVYSVAGGKFAVEYENSIGEKGTIEGAITNGAFDVSDSVTISLYLNDVTVADKKYTTGVLTLTGENVGVSYDGTTEKDENDEVKLFNGAVTFTPNVDTGLEAFFTVEVNDYERYSVQTKLYDYGKEILAEKAYPTYEFSLSSDNFLFSPEFEAFRDQLKFGKCIYLMLGSFGRQEAPMIGLDLDFSDHSKLDLVFSNRFQRHDGRAKLKDMIGKTYSSSRSFESSKILYSQAAKTTSSVTSFMNGAFDASKNRILAATDESVEINGSGIHIGGNKPKQMRLVGDMLAMTSDNWNTARLALGSFTDLDGNERYGINASLLMGKMILGESMRLENVRHVSGDNGIETTVMQFAVNEEGVKMDNATLTMTTEAGGKIVLDPRYGFIAGSKELFSYKSDGSYSPNFLDEDKKVDLDTEGIPKNANFYLDNQTGEAYFRGKVVAGSGDIGGWNIGGKFEEAGQDIDWTGRLYSGAGSTYVALNASGESGSDYAIWAGAEDPNSSDCKFYVRRDGTVKVKGDLDASSFSIGGETALDADNKISSGFLNLKGLAVYNGTNKTFEIDTNGNVHMYSGTISWNGVSESGQSDAYEIANTAKATADGASLNAEQAKARADAATTNVNNILYPGTTKIDGSKIYTGSITTNSLKAGTLEGFTIISEGDWGDITISDSMIKLGKSGILYGDDVGNMFVQTPESFRIYMGKYRYYEFSGSGINYYRSDDDGYTFDLISYAQFNQV